MFGSRYWTSRAFDSRFWLVTGADGVEASGFLAISLTALRTLLAATDEFQTWVGAGDATTAAESIYLGAVEDPDRPAVVLSIGPARSDRDALGARAWFLHGGQLHALWLDDIDDPTDFAAAEAAFLGQIDTIMRAALDLCGSGEYISLRRFALDDDPRRSHQDDPDDVYEAASVAEWGEP